MAKQVITENYIRQIIQRVIQEGIYEGGMLEAGQGQSDAIEALERLAGERRVAFENMAARLQNLGDRCMEYVEIVRDLDSSIKEMFPDIQGPMKKQYDGWLLYQFAEPIPYDGENDTYAGHEDLENELLDLVPEEYKETINIYLDTDRGNYAAKSITITVDFPEVPDME